MIDNDKALARGLQNVYAEKLVVTHLSTLLARSASVYTYCDGDSDVLGKEIDFGSSRLEGKVGLHKITTRYRDK